MTSSSTNAEVEALRARVAALEAGAPHVGADAAEPGADFTTRVLFCMWCGHTLTYADNPEATLVAMRAHSTACTADPNVQRVAALEAEVERLKTQVSWYEEERNRGGIGMGTDPAGEKGTGAK